MTGTATTASDPYRTSTRRRRVFGGLLAGLALTAGFALSATEEASAYPTHCVMTTYFKEAAHQHEVGVRTTCPGGHGWGVTSRYFEREVIDLSTPAPGHPGPGSLPCEFMASGC